MTTSKPKYIVEITHPTWGGTLSDRPRPAITGTLNQCGGLSDADASSVTSRRAAAELIRLCVEEGAARSQLRVRVL